MSRKKPLRVYLVSIGTEKNSDPIMVIVGENLQSAYSNVEKYFRGHPWRHSRKGVPWHFNRFKVFKRKPYIMFEARVGFSGFMFFIRPIRLVR
jgi:hypothetical protein